MSWLTKNKTPWWVKLLNALWNDTTVTWDALTSAWDATDGKWETKYTKTWYTKN